MKNVVICRPYQSLLGYKMNNYLMGETYIACGEKKREVHTSFWWGNLKEGDRLKNINLYPLHINVKLKKGTG